MGERCKLPNRGLGQLCNFYNVEVTKHRIIITIKVVGGGGGGGGGGGVQSTSGSIRKVGGGGGGAVRFRSDAFLWHTENTLSFIINGYNFDRGGCSSNRSPPPLHTPL